MKLERISIDRTALASELLPLFKSHCRVEFSRDDDYLKSALTRALDIFERLTEFHVFAASFVWSLPSGVAGSVEVPLQPIDDFVVTDQDGGDVSADFELVGTVGTDQMARQWLQPVAGASWPSLAVVTLATGYETGADLPPGILDICFRIGAFLYENREMVSIGGVDVAPYANSLITAYWVPRA